MTYLSTCRLTSSPACQNFYVTSYVGGVNTDAVEDYWYYSATYSSTLSILDSLARQPLAGKEGLDTLRYSSCASGIQLLRNAYTARLDN